MINHEIKSQLAKLLATEDLVVENKQVETACFNVHTRVLTLPIWDRASGEVYDLLVGHEVGHALFTPDVDWSLDNKIPPQFVNVVEDVRIERLMKRKYAGLAKTFYRGYKELSDEDFFQIEDEDVSTFNLADKANLYFKIGSFVPIKFDDEENDLIEKINSTETFDDVLRVSMELYEFCKRKQEQETKSKLDHHQQPSMSGDSDQESKEQTETENFDDGQSEQQSEQQSESPDMEQDDVDQEQTTSGNEVAPEVQTMKSFEDAVRDLASNMGYESVYAELPNLNLDNVIVPNAEIHKRFDDEWGTLSPEIFDEVDSEYKKFKRNAQKEVNYLVKEFECRKSASAYARASTSRTGVLDCSKLHTYKFNEDIFKKVTTFANGKNHGLIFILDWSGSMGDVLSDTVKQMFNLIWFCKKVSIPYDVYAFTNEYPRLNDSGRMDPAYEKRDGLVQVKEYFSLMNILSSNTKGTESEAQMLNIFRIARYFCGPYCSGYNCPIGMSLSGTPLNETLIALHQIIPQFKSRCNVEKVQCVILTDGEAPPLKYHKLFDNPRFEEPYIGVNSLGCNSFIRDRKTGNTYSLNCEWYEVSNVMLRILRDRMPDVNFIGIRVLAPRDASGFIRQYNPNYLQYDKVRNFWRKNKTLTILNSGYHKYFGIAAAALNSDSEFDVKEDATKSQIKSAFTKSLKGKKMNKKVLSEFIDLIA